MIKDERAYQEMIYASEMFLQEKVEILLAGQKELERFAAKLPLSWKTCLAYNIPSPNAIQEIWKGLGDSSFNFIDVLAKNVYTLGLVISISNKTPIGLSYIFRYELERGVYYKNWIGGFPASNIDFQYFVKANGGVLPLSYQAFCSVHNGFLWGGNLSSGFLPIQKLAVNQNILPFCGDGAANFQVYNLREPIREGDYMTYDWDHETRELSHPVGFWNFVRKYFSMEFST